MTTPTDNDFDFGSSIDTVDFRELSYAGVKVEDTTSVTAEQKRKFNEDKAKNARKALISEAVAKGDVAFEFEGETYTVPPADEWDLAVIENIEDNRLVTAIRALLGPAQWAVFNKTKRKAKELGPFFEAAQEALGAQSGE